MAANKTLMEYKWVDVSHTDPEAGATALNQAGADGWVFAWVDTNISAHSRVWMTREAPPKEPDPKVEPKPEPEVAERKRGW